jgi:hypothetical protein
MHTRDEVRTALDHNFKSLMDCLGQLTEEELTQKPVTGAWTVKDIIGHVWDRGEEALRTAKTWPKPNARQEGVVYDDRWNEAHAAARQTLPLITVVDGITGVHRRLMHFLDLAEDDVLAGVGQVPWSGEMPLIEMVYEVADHYAQHALSLAVFQLECLDSDNPKDSPC